MILPSAEGKCAKPQILHEGLSRFGGEKVLCVLLIWGERNFYCILDPRGKKYKFLFPLISLSSKPPRAKGEM